MEKVKKHYAVYWLGTGYGCYRKDYCKEFLGDTWATSKNKACSNVRYRMRDNKNPNGGFSKDFIGNDEDYVTFKFEAFEI